MDLKSLIAKMDAIEKSAVLEAGELNPQQQAQNVLQPGMNKPAEAPAGAPTTLVPTHFHKGNLGNKLPLMLAPDGKFYWETNGGIQPWQGNTENRSGWNPASVDGEIKDGQYIDYPEGTTWKMAKDAADKQTAADTAALMEKLKTLLALVDQYTKLKAAKAQKTANPAEKRNTAELAANNDLKKSGAMEGRISIAQSLVESFGYKSEQLDEYSMSQLGSDAGDLGRGVWNGLTLGAGDNIAAGVKSAFGPGKYKDELAKQTAASQAAEKRSPYLYGGGQLAGGIAAPIPGGAAVAGLKGVGTLGKIAAQGALNYGATKAVDVVKSKHDLKTLGGGKGDPKIAELQKLVGAVPDGLMGPKTKAAVAAWQQENGLPATGAADPATMQAAGIAEGRTMKTVAESIKEMQNRLAMIESRTEEQTIMETIKETYGFTDEDLSEELYVDEAGNFYKSNGDQITDEGWMDAIGKGAKALGRGLINRTNPTMAATGNTMIKSTAAEKALNAAGRKVNKAVTGVGGAIARNPGKAALGLAGAGALAGAMAGDGGQGGSTTPVAGGGGSGGKTKPDAAATAAQAQQDAAAEATADKEMAELKAKIDALVGELSKSQNPEIQKGLADIKSKLEPVAGSNATPPASPTGAQAGAVAPNMSQVNTPDPTLKVYK